MDRRILVTSIIAVIGSTVTGCLENGEFMNDSSDSGESSDPADTTPPSNDDSPEDGDATDVRTNDGDNDRDPNNEGAGVRETWFKVLGSDFEFEVAAAVTFENDTVSVTGIVQGNNTCYTARLDEVTIEDRTLVVNVESYEDADEDEGCGEAVIGIEYEAVIELDGDLPAEVIVEHNGERVTAEQSS